ncbi:hypothetical protein HZA33_00650 [Candidatus Pacearchaeota archaeon]|nr:hypothetical protein [Candidatus Pacearchaeota archaeon]
MTNSQNAARINTKEVMGIDPKGIDLDAYFRQEEQKEKQTGQFQQHTPGTLNYNPINSEKELFDLPRGTVVCVDNRGQNGKEKGIFLYNGNNAQSEINRRWYSFIRRDDSDLIIELNSLASVLEFKNGIIISYSGGRSWSIRSQRESDNERRYNELDSLLKQAGL